MTNIVGQLFKSLDPWPGFQITSFKIQVSPVDGRKTLILDLRPVEGSMPICSRCRHEARECQDFCVWGGYSRGSPTRLPFVFL